jgi:hypothetical protein
MDSMPATIDQATRTAVTARITAHVQRGWPRLGTPPVRFRGQFCYVDAVLPGHRQPAPILRPRYQGSADRWDIGIYLASDERSMSGACDGTPMEDTSASSWPPWAAPIVARRPVNRACTARKGWR